MIRIRQSNNWLIVLHTRFVITETHWIVVYVQIFGDNFQQNNEQCAQMEEKLKIKFLRMNY